VNDGFGDIQHEGKFLARGSYPPISPNAAVSSVLNVWERSSRAALLIRSFKRYEVPLHKDWVILDALNHIKDRVDGSLSFRWSCRMGVCGSCGMLVNGEPTLSCSTFLSTYARERKPIRVEPLTSATW
jgi:succinate dehydrogenase/fumarate reductase-like Fe-S protein